MKEYNLSTAGKRIVKNFIFAFVLMTSPSAWAQIEFSMGLEGGVNSSGLPYRNQWTTVIGASAEKKDLPLIRALGGAWGKVKFRKHVYVSIGVQYTTVGSRYTEDHKGYDKQNGVNFKSQFREDFTFDKITYPLLLGYDFRIRRLPVSFFIGYRPALHTSGKYYSKASYSDESGLRDASVEEHIDPFDRASLAIEAHRHLKQFLVGTGVAIRKNLSISFLCATGERIVFFEYVPQRVWEASGYDHYYERWDLVLSLKYTLLRFPKNKP